ncbi:MAG: glucose sorbosone dehydrogenase [Fibrobacteres bacterium]|nr:glucose sorbosone dehydrogenase [Fibrobacterota bacterium]
MKKRARAFVLSALGLLAAASGSAAGLSTAIREFDGRDDYPLPAKLSLTGLYSTTGPARILGDGIVPFQVNSPLWSDGAAKERFISLPAGAKVIPTDTDSYAFPEKTVFIKNFRIDTVYGDSSSRILVETRFLVRRSGEPGDNPWHGISYKWARDQSDADLVSQASGENVILNVRMGGTVRGKRYTYPSKFQCVTCHFNRGILGFITPQLNRPSLADSTVNQLQALRDQGVLSADPVAGKPGAFRWAGLNEKSAPLELRARSYFASNCSQCHGNGPIGSSPGDHIFDFFHPEISVDQGSDGKNGAYVGKLTHQGGEAFPQFIFKGYPESSYVMKRMMVRQDFDFTPTEQMPTLATFQPDSAGLSMIKDWICSLGNRPGASCRLPDVQADGTYWDQPAAIRFSASKGRSAPPTLRGGILRVTQAPSAASGLPGLYDLRGKALVLARAGRWEFRVLTRIEPGIYLVRTAAGTALVQASP